MDPAVVISAIEGLVSIGTALTPEIQSLVQSGQISADLQASLLSKIDGWRTLVATPGPLVNDGKAA